MCLRDLQSERLEGFTFHAFNLRPSVFSQDAMWLMQTDSPLPAKTLFGGNKFADPSVDFLSNHHKTRIFAHYWSLQWNPTGFDPRSTTQGWKHTFDLEPSGENWGEFRVEAGRLRLPRNPYKWIIYWGMMGHSGPGWRVEGSAVPVDIHLTLSNWFALIRTILPVIPADVAILVHPDHSTARLNPDGSETVPQEGFCFARGIDLPDQMTWADLREAERRCLER